MPAAPWVLTPCAEGLSTSRGGCAAAPAAAGFQKRPHRARHFFRAALSATCHLSLSVIRARDLPGNPRSRHHLAVYHRDREADRLALPAVWASPTPPFMASSHGSIPIGARAWWLGEPIISSFADEPRVRFR